MEKARHRRSKSTTSIEGSSQIPKIKALPRLVSDSHSYFEGNINDGFTSQLDRNSLKHGSGIPIKNLLANEMAKEKESRRRSPSLIARLMGLDGLPSPPHGHRQQRRSLDKHQQPNASKNIHHNKKFFEGSSSRSSVDERRCKDVYEDLKVSNVTNRRCSSKWSGSPRLSKPETALGEKVQASKGFDDTLEWLGYLQQSDSSFVKHLRDLPVAPSSPFYSHAPPLGSSDRTLFEYNAKSCKSERANMFKHEFNSLWKREDGHLVQAQSLHCSHNSCNQSRGYVDVKNEESMLPTRIVVLKPNIGKSGNFFASTSSPSPIHTQPSYRNPLESTNAVPKESSSWKKKHSSSDAFSPDSKMIEDREMAKRITRRLRDNFELNISLNSGVKGYAGDESSCGAYESDSSSVSDEITLASRHSFDGNIRFKHSSPSPSESSVSKEAKKRLSERWKTTHKCQDVEPVGMGSTLGEMLALPDMETRTWDVDAAVELGRSSGKLVGSNKYFGWDDPAGTSSWGGWKDGCVKSSSSATILSRTSVARSPVDDPMSNKKMHQGRNKIKNGRGRADHSLRSDSPSKPYQSGDSSESIYANSSSPTAKLIQNRAFQHEIEEEPNTAEICSSSSSSSGSVIDLRTKAEHESLIWSSQPSVDSLIKHQSDTIRNCDSSFPCDNEDTTLQELSLDQPKGYCTSLQCPRPEPEASEISKEDHPSPVSVLEVASVEDESSSSDCFERVNAELRELRMQLRLLKMESGDCSDAPMLFKSNEGVMQRPELVKEELFISEYESWKSSYIVDVLLNSGLQEFELGTFLAMWYSLECPLDPRVFDDLEKKHYGEKVGLKVERKLLFDCINSVLLEIFELYTDPYPWVSPEPTVSHWEKHRVKDTFYKMLAYQEDLLNANRPEIMLDGEMNWLGFRDEIDILGKEIEKLLISDLIGEIVVE